MSRSLLVAVLLVQVAVAQQPASPEGVIGRLDSAFLGLRATVASAAASPRVSAIMSGHFYRDRPLDAVNAGGALLTASPEEIVAGLRVLRDGLHIMPDDGTALRPSVTALVADLRSHIARLPPAAGAEAAREMLWLEHTLDRSNEAAHQRRIEQFESIYRGTPAYFDYLIGQVETKYGYEPANTRPHFLALAREHDGTAVGAHALYALGFRLAHDAVSMTPEVDPTERFLEVMSIVNRLESGRFPKCQWVDDAPKLIIEFQTLNPEYSAPNIARMYDAYLAFAISHLANPEVARSSIEYRLEVGLAELHPDKREALPLIERFIVDLMKGGVAADVALDLQAGIYLSILVDNSMGRFPISPAEAAEGARRSLRVLMQSSTPRVQARALADLAALDFHLGRYREAREQYLAFAGRYPSDGGAWVAALRAAQAREAIGDVSGAAGEYEAIATRFASRPYAATLAGIAAGETRESLNQFAVAAEDYRSAVASWPFPTERLMIYSPQAVDAKPLPNQARFNDVRVTDLEQRLTRLAAAATPEGALLHQARRSIEQAQPGEAVGPLQRVIDRFPGSPAETEARALLRRAQFDMVLLEHRQRGLVVVDRELADLARGDYDDVVRFAKLARAALALQGGVAERAESMTRTALEEWHTRQPAPNHAGEFGADIAAIRKVLFLPRGGGVMGDGWNAFKWPKVAAPFVLLNRDVIVGTPDGKETTRSITFNPAGGERAIFLTPEDFAALHKILDKIGGTETREPLAIMETPNQPVGGSVAVAALWGKFFHVRPGHWGGWELSTYPYLSKITFDRADHALAEVTIGYSGGTIELVKENGVWIAKRFVSHWIT